MPKTPAKKKSVKVTQPDPKAKGGAILDARNRAMEEERLRVMRIIEPLTLRVTVLESTVLDLYARLPALEPKEPEPWVPKELSVKMGAIKVIRFTFEE